MQPYSTLPLFAVEPEPVAETAPTATDAETVADAPAIEWSTTGYGGWVAYNDELQLATEAWNQPWVAVKAANRGEVSKKFYREHVKRMAERAAKQAEPQAAPTVEPMTFGEMTCHIWRHKPTGATGLRILHKLTDAQVESMHGDVSKLRDFPASEHLPQAFIENLANEFEALKIGEAYAVTVKGAGLHYYNLSDLEPSQRHL